MAEPLNTSSNSEEPPRKNSRAHSTQLLRNGHMLSLSVPSTLAACPMLHDISGLQQSPAELEEQQLSYEQRSALSCIVRASRFQLPNTTQILRSLEV